MNKLTSTPTQKALAEVRAAIEAGPTEGQWEACARGDYSDFDGDSRVILGDEMRIAVVQTNGRSETEANADLIAACNPENIALILADRDAMEKRNQELEAALLEGARRCEALKRDCGMDPESPIALQNGRYMSISYFLRAAIQSNTKG